MDHNHKATNLDSIIDLIIQRIQKRREIKVQKIHRIGKKADEETMNYGTTPHAHFYIIIK